MLTKTTNDNDGNGERHITYADCAAMNVSLGEMVSEVIVKAACGIALVPDTLGNVIANKNVNGDIVRTCEYWPYGEIRTDSDSNPTPFGYGGTWGYYSDPSGMLYVRARYYKPVEGRWLTVDPLWPGESAYGYCTCEPIIFTDPDGMAGQGCTGTNFIFCQANASRLVGSNGVFKIQRQRNCCFARAKTNRQ